LLFRDPLNYRPQTQVLAAEQTLDAKPEVLYPMVPDLIRLLEAEDASLRGDTADLLGQIGHPDARKPKLRCQTPNDI